MCFVIVERLCLWVLNGCLHFQASHSGRAGRMLHRIPFFSAVGVLLFQFFQRRQTVYVGHHHINVRAAGQLLGRNVLAREVVELVKYLLLKASESGLNGF